MCWNLYIYYIYFSVERIYVSYLLLGNITPKFSILKMIHMYHIVGFVGQKFRYSLARSSGSGSLKAAVLPWNREHPLPSSLGFRQDSVPCGLG